MFHPLESRTARHLAELGIDGGPVLVALSGGCDSVVLLYLLRFRLPGFAVSAAHVDHAMRPGSRADADWVRGLCDAWGVPLATTRLDPPPENEEGARERRYAFLRSRGAELIATAHHADDQAETVLFRAVRGTGLKGLAGIPALAGGVVRPLLPLWRREIEAYATERRLAWRTDPTNRELEPARNRLRHQVLPLIEREVAPGARRSLVALAALADEAEGALERLAAAAAEQLVRWDDDAPALARDHLPEYDPAIQARVLRTVLRRLGVVLGRAGTRRTLEFITDAPSGRKLPLAADLRVEIEFDRAVFRRAGEIPADRTFRIERADAEGEAEVCIGGERYEMRFGPSEDPAEEGWVFRGDAAALAFPLWLRGWRHGDRMGSRSLKRRFLEARIPRERRRRLPVLADASGRVLWVAGLTPPLPPSDRDTFVLRVRHA